ncbi:polysaccharide biosynthesis protein [Piscinibacter koreensis]|uniref:Polysaccharide biosynthesis protein n=1 Tax=Piscinibacter koreensis TaxID=2742824 RepID=A0A7Y6NPL6_9BURK|nr:nucleoside-diphosphate sugar epimerase/dehydratase [Schlegelella koreensis]NUZ06984.1 polysaccharide biosynthesis protein [Schlegelella koreensis]
MSSTGFWSRVDAGLARLRVHRVPLIVAVDALVVCFAWNFTYLFRLGFERWWSARPGYDAWVMLGVALVYSIAFVASRIPLGMWRFSGFAEVKRLSLACLVAGALSAAVVMGLELRAVPRAVLALHPVVTLMSLCIVRLVYRALYEHARAQSRGKAGDAKRAVVMGAGAAARLLLAGLHDEGWDVLALLDDDPAKRGARVAGVSVRGTLADVASEAIRGHATHVIVAMPGVALTARRRAIELASATGLAVLTVPSMSELHDERAPIERVRRIEPEDVLGREPVELDEPGIAGIIAGKTVLVTGAGGSIGSELCRQVARYGPAQLVLFEASEFALYQIEQSLGARHPELPLVRLIGDVRSGEQLRSTFQRHRPQLVLHAAAYKHVPLMEDDNAWAALTNNTLGTVRAARAAAEAGVERFVLISTDKAVNPTSVMGASKRAAEMALSYLATEGHATRFSAVRFGNVLGSSGSVIPKFKEQIAAGGPVTVTHPAMTRYFMTIPEAARLVLQAAALAESGQVYVLDMGEPIRIVDLARQLIRLAGYGEREIEIVFSGPRPGEKLYEELLGAADRTLPAAHPSLRIARLRDHADDRWMNALLDWLEGLDASASPESVRARLRELVPEYQG